MAGTDTPHDARMQAPGADLTPGAPPLVVLGVDPGSIVTGYGVVRAGAARMELLACGVLRPRGGSLVARLVDLYQRMAAVIHEWRPDELAIEEPFTRVNARSAFILGKAQAAAILAAAHAGVPVFEYPPAAVKQAVTSYGRSDKAQVQEMVRLLFGLPEPPQPADAADALAVALCHLNFRRTQGLLARAGGRST